MILCFVFMVHCFGATRGRRLLHTINFAVRDEIATVKSINHKLRQVKIPKTVCHFVCVLFSKSTLDQDVYAPLLLQ